MSKIYHPIKINFTEEEYQKIHEHAKRCGLTKVELCRLLLQNYHPKPLLGPVFREHLTALYTLHELLSTVPIGQAKLREIILSLEENLFVPERKGGGHGDNQPMGDQGTD